MTKVIDLPREDFRSVMFPCFEVVQPVGRFYLGVMRWDTLRDISYFDVRRIVREERAVETYLGIQRPLNPKRVEELQKYVNVKDASFPTGIIIAVESECASYNAETKVMTLSNNMETESDQDRIFFRDIARVIDGQHRIAGLEGYLGENFDLPVAILVGMDIADQAFVFSTVNLAQTKVSPSLAYDLFSFAKARSPQKTCHNIAVALDEHENSPFFRRIKRLGVATEGRFNETITQAAFIRALMPYISSDPILDRDALLRGKSLAKTSSAELQKHIFRNMFIEAKDLEIMDVVWNYFSAVKERWPEAWANLGEGNVLNRTSGFRAFMRALKPAYLFMTSPGEVPSKEQFLGMLRKVTLADADFSVNRFKPGSSGESLLFHTISAEAGLAVA